MRVAIAGGSSQTLGSSILSALMATDGRYTPVILSRAATSGGKHIAPCDGVDTRYVDYHSHSSLVSALRDVDTVISVLLIPGPDWVTVQLNLLRAAEAAGCRRFAPSEFALTSSAHTRVDLLDAKNTVWEAVQRSVDDSRIDAARFPCGMFMNYLGIGCPDTSRRKDALAGFQEGPFLFHLDASDPWVEVPVQSDRLAPNITMTDIRDIGRFVVAALDITEPWAGRELGMSGDTLNFKEVIDICQRYLKRPIETRLLAEHDLDKQLPSIPQDQTLARMECQLAKVCARGDSVVPPVLNNLCSLQPITVSQFMERYWGSEAF